MNKQRLYYFILAVGIILNFTALFRGHGHQEALINNVKSDSSLIGDGGANTQTVHLEGVLYKTDNPMRGNLKLESGNSDIYIRTSRDFSSLIGFQVLVVVSGTTDNFELIGIQPKVIKNGFLTK